MELSGLQSTPIYWRGDSANLAICAVLKYESHESHESHCLRVMTKLSKRLASNYSMQPVEFRQVTSRDEIEFEKLFKLLAPKKGWEAIDYSAWHQDLCSQKKLTIACLRALANAVDKNRELTVDDWGGLS